MRILLLYMRKYGILAIENHRCALPWLKRVFHFLKHVFFADACAENKKIISCRNDFYLIFQRDM